MRSLDYDEIMITRLQFHRSLPSSIIEKDSLLSIEVKLSGEFHEVLSSYPIAHYTIGLTYHTCWGGSVRGSARSSSAGSSSGSTGGVSGRPTITARHYFSATTEEVVGSSKEVCCLPVEEVQRTYKSNGQLLRVRFRSPSLCGHYSLEVHATTTTSPTSSVEDGSSKEVVPRVIILPVLSDIFEVVEGGGGGGGGNILLANYRPVTLPLPRSLPLPLPRVQLLVKECYGSVLGGHVYDSAVVLADYLLRHHYFEEVQEVEGSGIGSDGVMVELGAGCGLVSMTFLSLLALATRSSSSCYYHRVIVTDRPAQLPLLEENLSINTTTTTTSSSSSSSCVVACQALSWECREDIEALLTALTPPPPPPPASPTPSKVVVLAADVLYDSEGARLFCEVVREMVETLEAGGVKVEVMVAQKDRQHTGPPRRRTAAGGGGGGGEVVYEEQVRGGLQWQCVEYNEVAEVILWQLTSIIPTTTTTTTATTTTVLLP